MSAWECPWHIDNDEENIRVASLLDIIYDDGDDDFEDNPAALTNWLLTNASSMLTETTYCK